MIHVHKDFNDVPKSLQLTEEEYELLKQGKELDKSYYEQDVLDALTEVYGGKCAYCEQKVKGRFDRGVQAQNIFHYRPVRLYPWLKYEWSNLLLVCNDCLRRSWNDKITKFITLENKVDLIPNNVAEWKADSKILLNEQPLLLHPEIDNPYEYFVINAEGILLPKNGNVRALFTIGFFNLTKNRYGHEISALLNRLETASKTFKFDEILKRIKKELQNNINKKVEGAGYYQLLLDNIESFYQEYDLICTSDKLSFYRTRNWISSLSIQNVRHLRFVNIPLSQEKRQNLILTGKNGSGKTSVLENLLEYLDLLIFKSSKELFDKSFYLDKLHFLCPMFIGFNKYYLNLINQFRNKNFLLVYFPAKRSLSPDEVHEVSSEVNLSFTALNTSKQAVSKNLLRYLINQRAEQSFARDENDLEMVNEIQNWFDNFEKQLQSIFDDKNLELVFLRNGQPKKYTYEIHTEDRIPFGFNELADGYSAFLQIVVEILLRVQHIGANANDIEGIVLIDEVDAHLHVELQKKIMPLLTTFFPNIQFIVTTHSPFVLNSIENAVIYDLETNMRLEDASSISYSGLLEGFLKVPDEYSGIIKKKVARYEQLVNMNELTEQEQDEFADLDIELDNLSPLLSTDMYAKFKNVQKQVFKTEA